RDTILAALGVPAADGPLATPPGTHSTNPGRLASAVRQSANELDRSLLGATGGVLDLRFTVPLVLFGWAVLEVARGRRAPLAWSTALWYAHGLFRDYNLPEG